MNNILEWIIIIVVIVIIIISRSSNRSIIIIIIIIIIVFIINDVLCSLFLFVRIFYFEIVFPYDLNDEKKGYSSYE